MKDNTSSSNADGSSSINTFCFSGFRKRSQEEFYDMLTTKLIELLV